MLVSSDATLRSYAYKLDAALDRLMRITPVHVAGKKLQDAIKSCRRYLFVFLVDRAIPPTNNGSEQALRPCVTGGRSPKQSVGARPEASTLSSLPS